MVSAAEADAIRAPARDYQAISHGGPTPIRSDEVAPCTGSQVPFARAGLEKPAQALLELAVDIAARCCGQRTGQPSGIHAACHPRNPGPGRAPRHPQLCLNPGDVDIVRRHLGDELDANHWRISEDPRVDPGGCRVVTADGTIDATLGTRWKRALATLGLDAKTTGSGRRMPDTPPRRYAQPLAGIPRAVPRQCRRAQTLSVEGRLTRVAGLVMEAVGLRLPVGSTCLVRQDGMNPVEAEVVGFNGGRLS